ncbi:hypothetical protein H5410_032702 [Solanum commersonii]|uniref:Protein kinase domain-containing protein n=1 Tax=Solanum commersonii TaxID=4109 RepID=A0A9J5YQE4_SOLCO|nr:hypothetical protein H5410_032702 [Solanum commersonii]
MPIFSGLTRKTRFSSASAERRKKENDCYLKNGNCVLEEFPVLCDGNCRIPIHYFSAIEIENAIKHSKSRIDLSDVYITGSLDNRLVLVRFNRCRFNNIHRDIAVTAEMSHLKNVLRLVSCCLEFEEPVMVYEYVDGISLSYVLFRKGNHDDDQTRKSLLCWGNRLRIANEVASAIVFLHTEFTTPIIYKDLNPSNVIIDENSGKLEVVKDIVIGRNGYLAPEYAISGIVTQNIDVYSFGFVLLNLLTGRKMSSLNINIKDTVYHTDSDPEMIDIEEIHVMDIADSAILEEHGIEIQQQLEDCWNLVKKCTKSKREERPYMIEVAKELRRIHNCFRALTLAQNYRWQEKMPVFRGLTRKLFSSVSAERRKKEHHCYLQNGSCVLEELLALCDGNCRIPIRYFTAIEIHNAIKHSKSKMELSDVFNTCRFNNIHRDIAITAQMSHLKNVLKLVGCCLEFEEPVMGNRLRIANEVASAIIFLHTEFTTPIIHRDINPYKVIIDENSNVAKIMDFSLSISLSPGELEGEDGVCGTFGYVDPEYDTTGIISQKTDVYSFGVLLFQLLTGKEVQDIIDRVDSKNLKEKMDFEEDAKSNTEEDNTLDRVNSAILEETTDFKYHPPNMVDHYIKEDNVIDIVDPTIFEDHGIEIQQQLEDYLDLVKRCTTYNGDNRPYMIHVARELRRIEKCFRALTIAIG